MLRGTWLTSVVIAAVCAGSPGRRTTFSPGGLAPTVHYVSPSGTDAGDGTAPRPWNLSTALAGADGRIHPGDTVWLRGGRYPGSYRTALDGEPSRAIVFRQYPGERATIDGTLRADGSYLTFWGFEIMQSTPTTYGLQANTDHGRFINLVVHDAGTEGVSFWTPAVDAELYGCIIYNNGTHENLDHGVYVHNEEGSKLIADNVFFNNLARGIQVYASPKNPLIRNVRVEGNVSFNNGTISNAVPARENLIFNAPVPMSGMVADSNLLYFTGTEGINLHVGKYGLWNNHDIELRDNYAAGGGIGLEMNEPWQEATVVGNVFIGSRDVVKVGGNRLAHYHWADNTWVRDSAMPAWRYEDTRYNWLQWKRATGLGEGDRIQPEPPRETIAFVRPNRWERGRAYIVVYNWAALPSVLVDVSRILRPGERYELRNVQSVFAPPVAGGVYRGDSIAVPMRGVAPPVPLGRMTRRPPQTGPAFDVFLLTRSP